MAIQWRFFLLTMLFAVEASFPLIIAIWQLRKYRNTNSSIPGTTCARGKGPGNTDMYGLGVRIATYIQVLVGLAATTPGASRGVLIGNIAFLSAFTTAVWVMLRNPSTDTLDLYVVIVLGNGLTMLMCRFQTIGDASQGMFLSFIRTGSLDDYHTPSQAGTSLSYYIFLRTLCTRALRALCTCASYTWYTLRKCASYTWYTLRKCASYTWHTLRTRASRRRRAPRAYVQQFLCSHTPPTVSTFLTFHAFRALRTSRTSRASRTLRTSHTSTEIQTVLMMLSQLLILGLWKVCTTLFWWKTLPAAVPQPGCEIYGYLFVRAILAPGAPLHTFHKVLNILGWVYWFICVMVFLLNLHRLVRIVIWGTLPTGQKHGPPTNKLRILFDLIVDFPIIQVRGNAQEFPILDDTLMSL